MTISRRGLLAFAITLAATAFFQLSPVRADTLADAKARDKLIIGVKTDYPPFGYLDSAGKNVGVEVELAHYIAEKILGDPSKVEFIPVVAANRIQFLQAGRIDMILATLGVTADRAKVIDFGVNYYYPGGGTLIAPTTSSVKSWETSKDQSICGIQGSYYNVDVTQRYGLKLVNFQSLPDAYKALEDNRCAGMVFDEVTLKLKLQDPAWKGHYAVVGAPYEHSGQAIGVRKDDKTLLDAVNKAVLQAEADGKMVAWEKQYDMPDDPWSQEQIGLAKKKLSE
jgi:polar amino acid transport system substrate-binding protein